MNQCSNREKNKMIISTLFVFFALCFALTANHNNNFVFCQFTCSPQGILEISDSNLAGTPTTQITISSPITNCHLYIHDLSVATTIIISSTAAISANSNITIRNVSSPSSTSSSFMIFDSEISDFGFINISNVSRRNTFNPTPEDEFIAIIHLLALD